MNTMLPLPLLLDLGRASLPILSGPRLPRVIRLARKSPLLHAGPMADNGVLSLNLAQGCLHRCAFCSARAHAGWPGDDVIQLYLDTAKRLEEELATRRRKPRAVYISPSTDPFMPLKEVQADTVEVVQTLARHGVESWLMTRGYIRPRAFQVLVRHRQRVRVTIGLQTLDRKLQRVLEPLAAQPRLRLRQIAKLIQAGIAVQVEVGPLIPGLTDGRANLEELLNALAAVGVHNITTGYVFLRERIQTNLVEALRSSGIGSKFLEEYQGGPVMPSDHIAPARYLPKRRRQQGYAALMALAAPRGIRVRVSSVTNPDFGPPAAPLPLQRLLIPLSAVFADERQTRTPE